MATLTETAYYTRKTINWLIVVVIAYFVLKLIWGFLVVIYLMIFPPKPPPPDYAFGKLPALEFPANNQQNRQLTYVLETISGDIPIASKSATVFFMPKKPANLLGLSKAKSFAERLGFSTNAQQESKNIYLFKDATSPLRTLRYDIVSENFIMRYKFELDPGLFQEKKIPFSDAAKAEAQSVLQTYELDENDIINGSDTVSFLKLQGNVLVPTTSHSRADAVRVDFFRQPIHGLPVLTSHPGEGSVAIIFSGSTNLDKRILQVAYTYWPVDLYTTATYGLKDLQVAWQELVSNQGFIAQYPSTGTQVTIRNAYLAYYDSFDPQIYLQPMYVFEGDHGFVGYVHAIEPEWVEVNTSSE